MDKKILESVFIIGLLALALGFATYSFYHDEGTSTENTFSSGFMDLRLDGHDHVTATWKSPSNWSPGKTVTGEILLTNVGNVYAMNLYFDFKSLVTTDPGGDGSNLAEKIYVTELWFHKDGSWIGGTSGIASYYIDYLFGDQDGIVEIGDCSLYELAEDPGYNPCMWACDKSELTWVEDRDPPAGDNNKLIDLNDIVETPTGAPQTKGVIDVWDGIKMTFTFDPDAGNEYMRDTASFELEVGIFNEAATQVHYGGEGCGYGYK